MRTRVNMPVLGGHNRLVPVVVILNVFANERGDLGSPVGCQRPTGAEIVLNINNNECFCHETILENPWGSVKGGGQLLKNYMNSVGITGSPSERRRAASGSSASER